MPYSPSPLAGEGWGEGGEHRFGKAKSNDPANRLKVRTPEGSP